VNQENYFVQVERLNSTGTTMIITMMTPINVIQSVDPACEVVPTGTVDVGVGFAIAVPPAWLGKDANDEAVSANNIPTPMMMTGSKICKRFLVISDDIKVYHTGKF